MPQAPPEQFGGEFFCQIGANLYSKFEEGLQSLKTDSSDLLKVPVFIEDRILISLRAIP